jgi:hypothetical protein
MEMSARSVRDGVVLVSAYHYFLALASLVGSLTLLVYAVIPPLTGSGEGIAGKIFFPIIGLILGLILTGLYISVAIGITRYNNASRVVGIFLAALGLLSGFVSVLGSLAITLTGNAVPDWLAVTMIGAIAVCVYAVFAFMDLFVLIFLFNNRVRSAFYGWEGFAPESEK